LGGSPASALVSATGPVEDALAEPTAPLELEPLPLSPANGSLLPLLPHPMPASASKN
jgi:hypothetical protein